ncbi:helix-turn-helix transcriptional regulator [uncultured Draconibacterium sp.]|uniref:helix-turn-helix domain-containing protein n=1 Tax=uncultured Draconibacterium sp. TaxID=1573823 RepID=UPI0025DC4E9A|nr:helix-turn-helix transcriptional regulator [uncultured Draconibacterium sp.]
MDGLNHEFELLDLGERFEEKSALMTVPHRAQFYHIIWIEKGKGTHYVDFDPIELEDNMVIFIPYNSVNQFDKNGTYKGRAIIFTDDFFSKNEQDNRFLRSSILFSDLYPTGIVRVNPQFSDLQVFLNAIETEFLKEYDRAQFQILHNMLHIFLLQAERELRKQGHKELKPSINLDYVILFKDLLEQNYRKEKSVNKYAADLSISDKQLHKATKALFDKTPKQVIDERVLLEAKRLVVHTALSIKEIAYELGYDEPTNFIKYFRKHTGVTPSEFRASF